MDQVDIVTVDWT